MTCLLYNVGSSKFFIKSLEASKSFRYACIKSIHKFILSLFMATLNISNKIGSQFVNFLFDYSLKYSEKITMNMNKSNLPMKI